MTDRRETACWIALLAVTGAALYLCWLMLQPFVDVLLWAIVLAIVFRPLQNFLEARTGRPALSALLSCILVVLVILLPLGFVIMLLAREVAGMVQTLPAQAAEFFSEDAAWLQKAREYLGDYIDVDALRTREFYAERLQGVAAAISSTTIGIIGNIAEVIFKVFLILFALYYLFLDGPALMETLRKQLPLDDERSAAIVRRMREVIDATLYGVVAVAMVQGILGGLIFWILGLPSPVLWGMVMTILAIIPVTGTPFVWVPAALYLLWTDQWGKGIFLLAWGGLVVAQIDNFLGPRLIGKRARLHVLVIFFAVLGGLKVFGFLGLFLGPVAVAVTKALLDVLEIGDPPPQALNGTPPASPLVAKTDAMPPPAPEAPQS